MKGGKAETSLTPEFSEVLSTSDDVMGSPARLHRRVQGRGMDGLPPMAAGAFGYLGYDMVRAMSRSCLRRSLIRTACRKRC